MTAGSGQNSAAAQVAVKPMPPEPIEAGHYPKQIVLRSGMPLNLRLMTAEDARLLHEFFCGIPNEDLLFLRRNVTDRAVIDQWAGRVGAGAVVTVLAIADDKVVGEASLHMTSTPWSAHVGEVRVVVDLAYRQTGLGTRLTSEIFLLAIQRGIRKIIAEMTIEQKGAITVFQKLGFRVEGLLRNHVSDQNGTTHDVILMGHETQEFYEQMRAYGFEETLATEGD